MAGAAVGMLLVGAVVSPATASPGGGVHADPPGEVIRYPIYERNFNGLWANDRFSGSCPTTHPYLTDKRFSNDRILPAGVIVTTASSVATLVVATSSETRIEGKKEFVAVKSIEGSWTNWDSAREASTSRSSARTTGSSPGSRTSTGDLRMQAAAPRKADQTHHA